MAITVKRVSGEPAAQIAVVILAAGRGVRMGSELPKALVPFEDRPTIHHVLEAAMPLSPERLVVVTGFGSEQVEESVKRSFGAARTVSFSLQQEQRGTGDAVRAAREQLQGFSGTVLILYVDIPLISTSTLNELLGQHHKERATLSFLTLFADPPSPYGKVLRDPANGNILKIIEERDCSVTERLNRECNSGIYCVESAFLLPALEKLTPDNAQQEYYLTDIVELAANEGQSIIAVPATDQRELSGFNTPAELFALGKTAKLLRAERLQLAGVLVEDPTSIFCDAEVTIAPGARIGPNVVIKGRSRIDSGVVIEGSCYLIDTIVEAGALLRLGVRAEQSTIGCKASVGPFAHLRPGSVLGERSKIGNFVEMKNASLGIGAKANHLAYLGDCSVGKESNIGAGTIFCNYNGFEKNHSTVGERVMVGSNTTVVAPVVINDGAYVAAGTVVKKDISAGSLSFLKSEQVVRANWTEGFKARFKKS